MDRTSTRWTRPAAGRGRAHPNHKRCQEEKHRSLPSLRPGHPGRLTGLRSYSGRKGVTSSLSQRQCEARRWQDPSCGPSHFSRIERIAVGNVGDKVNTRGRRPRSASSSRYTNRHRAGCRRGVRRYSETPRDRLRSASCRGVGEGRALNAASSSGSVPTAPRCAFQENSGRFYFLTGSARRRTPAGMVYPSTH